ncbi:MAG TPA: hypothetical protein VMZ28_13090 [Kofleriaceae bacterium]|nr:hypothetical protein [Kofleriaceae bacterium]
MIHFWADVVVAVPLFVAPGWFLGLFGWGAVDPASARLVAAALFGIGVQSLLGRDESVDTYRAMLQLKIIWSGAATAGLVWSQLGGGPPLAWLFVAVFGGFHALWIYWRVALR